MKPLRTFGVFKASFRHPDGPSSKSSGARRTVPFPITEQADFQAGSGNIAGTGITNSSGKMLGRVSGRAFLLAGREEPDRCDIAEGALGVVLIMPWPTVWMPSKYSNHCYFCRVLIGSAAVETML